MSGPCSRSCSGCASSTAREAPCGARTTALFAGNTSGYPSASEADYALISDLAFYTQDVDQLVRLVQQSGLYRPEKHDKRNGRYATTLHRAVETLLKRDGAALRETYTPGRNGHNGHNGHRPALPPAASAASAASAAPAGDEEIAPDEAPTPTAEVNTRTFPLDVLPKRVQTFITTVADAVGCPVDLVAVPVLVAAGAAIGNAVELEIRPGWHERACLWALVVARSGDGKSPAHREAMRPLMKRQDRLFASDRAHMQTSGTARDAGGKREPKPVAEHAAITDSTLGALALALLASPRGLTMPLDEAASWVLSFNQCKGGKGADRPHWLKMWASEQTTIIRASREPVHLPSPFVAVSGKCRPTSSARWPMWTGPRTALSPASCSAIRCRCQHVRVTRASPPRRATTGQRSSRSCYVSPRRRLATGRRVCRCCRRRQS